jgi:prophage regulatory protein
VAPARGGAGMSEPENLRIIRGRRTLAELLGVSDMTIWRWERSGNLPARIKFGPNTIGWKAVDIAAWQAQRAAKGAS